MKKTILFLLISCLITGCATVKGPISGKNYYAPLFEVEPEKNPEYRKEVRQHYVNQHPNLSNEIKEAILGGSVLIGMTKEQVIASWGKPNDINKTVGSWGVHEQWIYGYHALGSYQPLNFTATHYLYFENDILTSFQD